MLLVVAAPAFLAYVAWNVWWLARGMVPPSVWMWVTGLPCPTTGVTRSLVALGSGEVREGFLYNPMALVFVALLGWSGVALVAGWKRDRRAVLPGALGATWLVSLMLAWVLKFAIGRAYW